jgi:uncharacterized protein YndB with AHSA1/START domain
VTKTQFIAEPGRQEMLAIRVYDAPRELVFKAWTDPNSIPHWWGPAYLTTTVEKMDVRQGGIWRFVQRDPGGNEHAFHGVYHESLAPERLVLTWEYEGMPGHVLLETVTFEEEPGGKTKLTDRSVFQTQADRDGMLQAGAEEGLVMFDRFAELLAKRQG